MKFTYHRGKVLTSGPPLTILYTSGSCLGSSEAKDVAASKNAYYIMNSSSRCLRPILLRQLPSKRKHWMRTSHQSHIIR